MFVCLSNTTKNFHYWFKKKKKKTKRINYYAKVKKRETVTVSSSSNQIDSYRCKCGIFNGTKNSRLVFSSSASFRLVLSWLSLSCTILRNWFMIRFKLKENTGKIRKIENFVLRTVFHRIKAYIVYIFIVFVVFVLRCWCDWLLQIQFASWPGCRFGFSLFDFKFFLNFFLVVGLQFVSLLSLGLWFLLARWILFSIVKALECFPLNSYSSY